MEHCLLFFKIMSRAYAIASYFRLAGIVIFFLKKKIEYTNKPLLMKIKLYYHIYYIFTYQYQAIA